jgi:hypothetical protein
VNVIEIFTPTLCCEYFFHIQHTLLIKIFSLLVTSDHEPLSTIEYHHQGFAIPPIMAPSAVDEAPAASAASAAPVKIYPPAKIYPVRDVKFQKALAPEADGREAALARPSGSVAIVIDNGALKSLINSSLVIGLLNSPTNI